MAVGSTFWVHEYQVHVYLGPATHLDSDCPRKHNGLKNEVIWRILEIRDLLKEKQNSWLGHEIGNPTLTGFANSGLCKFAVTFALFITILNGAFPVHIDSFKASF